MDIFTKKIIKSYRKKLFFIFLLIGVSCNEPEPGVYYGFTLTLSNSHNNNASYYKIPQASTYLTIENNGANYNVDFLLLLPYQRFFGISATNVNLAAYSFTDSSITANVNYYMLDFFETNYASERYTLAEGAINFHSLDTADFHCTFDYKFTYTDSNHVGEPFYTNTIHITDAEVRIKK
jgi:hypothetical protein